MLIVVMSEGVVCSVYIIITVSGGAELIKLDDKGRLLTSAQQYYGAITIPIVSQVLDENTLHVTRQIYP